MKHCNFAPIKPRQGVVTLFGYGIKAYVDRGHLVLEDGIGSTRRQSRFPRVGHGLRRLVIIGADGFVSLAALHWLACQDAAFAMLSRHGSVIVTTGPVRPSDARLRRAQGLAHETGIAIKIARELIVQKLLGQEKVIREFFKECPSLHVIADARRSVTRAKTNEDIRRWESKAALAYWSTMRELPANFSKADSSKIPEHWKKFGSRVSPLTNSPRLAVNPAQATLNYLYTLLEMESRLALAALGLDPGLGVLHSDLRSRDSLAADLMEAVRPKVDALLLNLFTSEQLRREWFFEQRDGNCRLMASFAAKLSETAVMWRTAVASYAEWIAKSLWDSKARQIRIETPATRLTQNREREAKGILTSANIGPNAISPAPARQKLTEAPRHAALQTPIPLNAHDPIAQARRAESKRRQDAALKAWNPAAKPSWLDTKTFKGKVQPRLAGITVPTIMTALAISQSYALRIRAGQCVPHPRHWLTLARLTERSFTNVELKH
jgi:CRISPR-associated endonuclease Cas1